MELNRPFKCFNDKQLYRSVTKYVRVLIVLLQSFDETLYVRINFILLNSKILSRIRSYTLVKALDAQLRS